MKIVSLTRVACSAVAAGILTMSASAGIGGTAAVDMSDQGNVFGAGQWNLGWAFLVNEDIAVSGVGYFDDNGDGLGASHDVGIWNSNQELLAWGTVTPNSPLEGFFRYADLNNIGPVVLEAGQTYYVAGVSNTDNETISATATTVPEITWLSAQWVSGTELAFPENNAGGSNANGYFGATFRIGEVPAPGALALLGFVGLIGKRRRR